MDAIKIVNKGEKQWLRLGTFFMIQVTRATTRVAVKWLALVQE